MCDLMRLSFIEFNDNSKATDSRGEKNKMRNKYVYGLENSILDLQLYAPVRF